ncbi:MAG: DUF456 domain-containing protein [Candidatus Atribacteria bacterium]|nr:DUF456 domain-containing protein [Candidatus Atribacteria bacterium]
MKKEDLVWLTGGSYGDVNRHYIFFTIGHFLGLLVGAFIGELLANKDHYQAIRSGLATFWAVLSL